MATLASSSVAESSMDDTFQTLTKPRNWKATNRHSRRRLKGDKVDGGAGEGDVDERKKEEEEEEDKDEECDKEVWDMFSKSFRQVQWVLDQNRALIQQVNENHQSKIPDNLVKNVALIREINGNISKIISLYSHLSANFSSSVHQRRAMMASKISDEDK